MPPLAVLYVASSKTMRGLQARRLYLPILLLARHTPLLCIFALLSGVSFMRRIIIILLLASTLLPLQAQRLGRLNRETTFSHWVGTWAAAPQPVVKSYMPFNNKMDNRSVRQIVKVSTGGDIVRLRLSNEYSTEPIEIRSVYISNALDSFAIEPK